MPSVGVSQRVFALRREEPTFAPSSKGVKTSQRGQGLNFDASGRDLCNVGYFHSSAAGVVRSFWLLLHLARSVRPADLSVKLVSERISGGVAPLRQRLAGDWKRRYSDSCSHVASCVSSCACRASRAIAVPSARGISSCPPAPEQGEHPLAGVTLPPGSVFLSDPGGSWWLRGSWVKAERFLLLQGETSPKNNYSGFGYPAL